VEELGQVLEPDQIEEQLEEARKQVVNSWSVTQKIDGNVPVLSSSSDPNPLHTDIKLLVGLLGASLLPWPRWAKTLRLPPVPASDVTEFACCRLELGDQSVSWLQCAPLDPPPGPERDRRALSRFLDPRTFLLWIRSLLVPGSIGEAGEDWDEEDGKKPKSKPSGASPEWWAPTLEEVLSAWSRNPASLVLIDKRVQHYLKLYQERGAAEESMEESGVLEEFRRTWQVLRRELVIGER
jgi:hypothetical protein